MTKNYIIYALDRIYRSIFPSRQLKINDFYIQATTNHPLQYYKKNFNYYDNFLGCLCSLFRDGDVIIDIGANIGDSAFHMLSARPNLEVICVEPSVDFFAILDMNMKNLRELGKQVKLVNAFISNKNSELFMVYNKERSSGHASSSSNFAPPPQEKTLTYTDLLEKVNVISPRFVKIDTDGYDYKVLNSIADFHINHSSKPCPPIFFEFITYLEGEEMSNEERKVRGGKYMDAVKNLMNHGWGYFVAFDNFGSPILAHTDPNLLKQLTDYCRISRINNNHIPYYFIDVLLYNESDVDLVSNAIYQLIDEVWP
ncbi:MAG: FkbM family methyltransferase [Magnetococcales bacterium]|nr:FkbM family methyltransferase [Magnetococcales bacterium]